MIVLGCGRPWTLGKKRNTISQKKNTKFSDPDKPNGEYEQFCIKFKNVEIATNFKDKFEASQNAIVDTGNFTPDRDVSRLYVIYCSQ